MGAGVGLGLPPNDRGDVLCPEANHQRDALRVARRALQRMVLWAARPLVLRVLALALTGLRCALYRQRQGCTTVCKRLTGVQRRRCS